ncbi:MAG TPA: hypothetical protein VIH28_10390 [Ignavibacteriaceae bacterium]
MEILLPDNIFARILSSAFDEKDAIHLHHFPAGLLSKKMNETKNAVGLIPTMDLVNNKELFISQSLGISFDESISNSYIYFNQKDKIVDEIVLAGDVSFNEGILTKILFSENYGVDVQLSFEKTNGGSSTKNRILVGDRNFIEGNLDSGISFAEEIIEMISAPYVNFVFASESEEALKKFHSKYQDVISKLNPTEFFENANETVMSSSRNYLMENLQHVVFDFDKQDLEGMKQLLQLPYYHGIIKDLIDVKFV